MGNDCHFAVIDGREDYARLEYAFIRLIMVSPSAMTSSFLTQPNVDIRRLFHAHDSSSDIIRGLIFEYRASPRHIKFRYKCVSWLSLDADVSSRDYCHKILISPSDASWVMAFSLKRKLSLMRNSIAAIDWWPPTPLGDDIIKFIFAPAIEDARCRASCIWRRWKRPFHRPRALFAFDFDATAWKYIC